MVGCAITVFEAMRQRIALGFYEKNPMPEEQQKVLLEDYLQRKKEGLRHLEQTKYYFKIPPTTPKH